MKVFKFGKDGSISHERTLTDTYWKNCPFYIMEPTHFRKDDTCLCDDANHRDYMIKYWGYKKQDFEKIPLREEP